MKRKGAEGLPARQRPTPAANEEEFTGTVNDLHEDDRDDVDGHAIPRSGWNASSG